MWRITVRERLRGSSSRPTERENPSADEIAELAEETIGRAGESEAAPAIETLRSFIDRSRATPSAADSSGAHSLVPMLEPILRWSNEAVEAAEGDDEDLRVSIQEFAGGIGLVERRELTSFAWHGDSVAVVPVPEGSTSVDLTYEPEREERKRRDTIKNNYADVMAVPRWWPWPEVEVNLDVVGFFVDAGDGPALTEIMARDPKTPRRYAFRLELASAAAGFLIVKPLYRLAKGLRVRARDPLREARVRRAKRRLRLPSPDLHDDHSSSGQPVVLVHGLGASAAELALMLEPLGLSPLRFEHDTFISIDDNARELAVLLGDRLEGADRIILLCHSRGGLVARAAADLVSAALASRLSIHTFGTPHLGTPLAEFGRIVPLIHFLGAARQPGDFLRAADRYLLPRTWRIPEGIEEMSPDDAFIARMLRAPHNVTEALNTWGARFEDGRTARWWHRQAARACRGVLADPHDLVVPQPSSLGAGEPQGPLSHPSTHFDYLGLPEIHDYVRALL